MYCVGSLLGVKLELEEFELAIGELREQVDKIVKESGFTCVAIDLSGYRTGAITFETLQCVIAYEYFAVISNQAAEIWCEHPLFFSVCLQAYLRENKRG